MLSANPEISIQVRRHHLPGILQQVESGEPDALPAYIPKDIRDANSILVRAILDGAEIEVIENQPDIICDGCGKFENCDFKD